MTVRATARGELRTSLEGTRVDVLICGASFAGLAVARELAGCGASILIVDRYEVGERATSACAVPTPWLSALELSGALRQEIEHMRFSTPHGSVRYRLPWSWSSFDYRLLCELLAAQGDARFETAKVHGRWAGVAPGAEGSGAMPAGSGAMPAGSGAMPAGSGATPAGPDPILVDTDRGVIGASLVVDALGWRRVLGADAATGSYQPPHAPLSRGLEVHPAGDGEDLDVWIDRSLIPRGYGWCVPAGGEVRVGVGSYAPRDHVREPTRDLAGRLGVDDVRYQGNWFPHRLRPAAQAGIFYVGDSAGHCLPLSGEGIRTAFYFAIACGRELRKVLDRSQTRESALRRYGHFSASHAHAYGLALRLQELIPRLAPRLLSTLLRGLDHQRLIDRAFGAYLEIAPPSFATPPTARRPPAAGRGLDNAEPIAGALARAP